MKLPSCSKPATFEILKPGSLTELDNCVKEITNVQNLTEIGYTNKDGADRKTSSEGPEGEGEESNNNEEESKPTVLVQIENTKEGDSNRLDGGRGGRKVVTGSKRTTSHIVWESDYVITSEWRIETDSKKPKLNGQANEKAESATQGQNCIPKRTKKVSKLAKAKKEAKQAKKELSESTLDTDLENYFIESKKKKCEENKMEVEEAVSKDVSKENGTTAPSGEENTESIATETEKMETDEPEKDQPVESNDDKEQWSDKWSDGKKENDDPMTEEEEQTLLDEDVSKKDDNKTEETQDSKISDLPDKKDQGETPKEPSPEKIDSAEAVQEEPPADVKSVPEETAEEKQEKEESSPEEPSAETSADSLPPLEDADASIDQPNDQTENEVIPWQRIVKVSIPEEAIGKTQIRQQDLINKIGKKNYGGKVYYEKGQTEAYLLVAESAQETVAAMTENPGAK